MNSRFLTRATLIAVFLLFALVAACGGSYDDDDAGADGDSSRAQGAADPAGGAPPAVSDQLPGVGADSGEAANLPSILDRKIVRTTTVEMTVDDVPSAIQLVETAATAAGGFVSASNLSVDTAQSDDDEEVRQRGTITIRVPSESYVSVMSDIRALVDDPRDIKSLSEDASEVTEEYTDLQSRLRNLEATEQQYLVLLDRAASIDEILTVQDRLNGVRGEIEEVQGRIQLLDNLTALATITVQFSLPAVSAGPAEPPTGQSWAVTAFENSWNASKDVAEVLGVVAITGAFVAAWIVIPSALILGAWWVINSRRARSQAA
jgi:hypothetical protein